LWLLKANPDLSALLTETLGGEEMWHRDLGLLSQLHARKTDPEFIREWEQV